MNEIKYKKTYLSVTVEMRKDGMLRPLSFRWKDGQKYEIDRVLRIEKAASIKVGGYGIRYTVMVEGKERYFFLEEGKWFIEEAIYPNN